MGFVGQQIAVGYHMYRYGLDHHDSETKEKGKSMVDFWVSDAIMKTYFLYGGILLIMLQPDKGGNIQVFFDVLWMAWRDYWMPIVFLWLTMNLRKRGIKLLKGLLLIW